MNKTKRSKSASHSQASLTTRSRAEQEAAVRRAERQAELDAFIATIPDAPRASESSLVHVSMTQQFGKARFHPENATARLLVFLLACDTLTQQHIEIIKRLGYKVLQVPSSFDPIEL